MSKRKPLSNLRNVPTVKFIATHLLIIGITITSVGSTVASQEKRNVESNEKSINEKTTGELYDSLKDYPNDFYVSNAQKRFIRNPFDKPLISFNGSKNTPNIKVIGFAMSVERPTVFLKIGLSEEKAYKVGDEIGNGYRVTQINMPYKQIYISNGNEIFSYEIASLLK